MNPRPSFAISLSSLLALTCVFVGGCHKKRHAAPPTQQWIPHLSPTGGANSRSLVLADVNRDAIADVVVANETNASFSLLRGRSDGTFADGVIWPAPLQVATVATGDVTGDRFADVVAASGTTNELAISPGRGDGTFNAPVSMALPWAARKILIVDWNGDAFADLVVSSATAPAVALLRGTGGGSFAAAQVATLTELAADFAVVDCNLDGRRDVVCTAAGAAHIQVLRNDGAGGLLPPVTSTVDPLGGLMACCDVTDDEIPDFVGVDAALTSLRIYRGNGAGGFGAGGLLTVANTRIDGLAIGDLDGDGRVDLVAAATGKLFLLRSAGSDSFGAPELLHSDPMGITWLTAWDQLANGSVDLIFVSGTNSIGTLVSVRPSAAGLEAFGVGSPECTGRIGMWANGSPRIGSTTFGYTATNAPPDVGGMLIQGGPSEGLGVDPFGVGVLIHVGDGFRVTKLITSNSVGHCYMNEPIPANPGLIGLPVFVQTLWRGNVGTTCAVSVDGITSSVGLKFTVQP